MSVRSFEFYIRFVLVKFANDTIVQPIDTEWFQFYVPNQDKKIQAFSESSAAVSIQLKSFERDRKIDSDKKNDIEYDLIFLLF